MKGNREVQLQITENEFESLCEAVGHEHLTKALGYLSTWNFNYPRVEIYPIFDRDAPPELVACYGDPEGAKRRYVIGAVWHGDHFGFHS
jgi:hypothetical protein